MGNRKKAGMQSGGQNIREENLARGKNLHNSHPFFRRLYGWVCLSDNRGMGKGTTYKVDSAGRIYLNRDCLLSPKQWAYVIAHCELHLAFGHFTAEQMPGFIVEKADGSKEKKVYCRHDLWNMACDIYVAKFLADMKFGMPDQEYLPLRYGGPFTDEQKIYAYLSEHPDEVLPDYHMDMEGLEHPLHYDETKGNPYREHFSVALAMSVSETVSNVGKNRDEMYASGPAGRMAQWFLNHYPLLGSLASAFRIVEDSAICAREEIRIAAVNMERGEIYVNPSAGLSGEELKFVLAHEYLHAGLQHASRCQGRDPYLWNIACDFVINGWLHEMQIGTMPEAGLLYDELLKDMSAEEIYDRMLTDMRRYGKKETFRGYGKGDMIGKGYLPAGNGAGKGVSLDEFCRNALMQGLEYQKASGRGYIPAGLAEEIRALAMPPIPWDVELARWFDQHFGPAEKKRTYARPSRRQGATPDIPRPRYVTDENIIDGRTFGVVVDTSGSMDVKLLGMALGSIASYAAAKDVPYVRVVFCDAAAYDAGYLAPEDIAGRVTVKGRGGTILQPGIDLLEAAKDFPKNGPILIITDGMIEEHLAIHRDHAFLVPQGSRLPFRAKGRVFRFGES